MAEIKIFGTVPPCAKCIKMENIARKVTEKYPEKLTVIKYDAFSPEGDKYGIMITPTLVINDTIVAQGKVLSEEHLEEALHKVLGG